MGYCSSSLVELLVVLLLVATSLLGHEIALLLLHLHLGHAMVAHHVVKTVRHYLRRCHIRRR